MPPSPAGPRPSASTGSSWGRTPWRGHPAQIVDRLGQWRERAGVTRVYLQTLDLTDLDQLELVAAEVAPQLA